MMKKQVTFCSWLSLMFAWIILLSCSQESSAPAKLEVRLTDAPGDYQQVNIDVQDVQVKAEDDASSSGWKSIDLRKGVYDLMRLTNGLDTLLGDVQLPAGKISQLRLILGTNNSVKRAGIVYALGTPSAQQSGLKIQVHTSLIAGITYKILLDFDAGRSIVATGSGNYILKPVIRSSVEAESGAIKGMVTPIASRPAIYVLSGSDTIGTSFADTTSGKFLFKGVPAGTYKLSFVPKNGYPSLTRDNVSVALGNVTDMGTVTILP